MWMSKGLTEHDARFCEMVFVDFFASARIFCSASVIACYRYLNTDLDIWLCLTQIQCAWSLIAFNWSETFLFDTHQRYLDFVCFLTKIAGHIDFVPIFPTYLLLRAILFRNSISQRRYYRIIYFSLLIKYLNAFTYIRNCTLNHVLKLTVHKAHT